MSKINDYIYLFIPRYLYATFELFALIAAFRNTEHIKKKSIFKISCVDFFIYTEH